MPPAPRAQRAPARAPVRVKVCGLRSLADLHAAEGADAVGVVVATPASPRNVPLRQARALFARVPPFAQAFAVTREHRPERLEALARGLPRAAGLQVHGVATAAHARRVRAVAQGRRLMLAVPAGEDALGVAEVVAPHADAVLLDTVGEGGLTGGTGRTHDWHASARVARDLGTRGTPVVLAGGLTPANVAEAARVVRPYAVDVSGGVEGPGGKSRAKVRALLEAARGAGGSGPARKETRR